MQSVGSISGIGFINENRFSRGLLVKQKIGLGELFKITTPQVSLNSGQKLQVNTELDYSKLLPWQS